MSETRVNYESPKTDNNNMYFFYLSLSLFIHLFFRADIMRKYVKVRKLINFVISDNKLSFSSDDEKNI